MMSLRNLFFLFLFVLSAKIYSQQPYCADSSIRIKFIFSNKGAQVINTPSISGTNIFSGYFATATSARGGIALFKTNWGDSILWAKKLTLNNSDVAFGNCYPAPGGTNIYTGSWLSGFTTNSDLLVSRIDTNGMVFWAKRYRLAQNHIGPASFGLGSYKNVLVTSTSIYLFTNFVGSSARIILKLDLDGNIIWSSGFAMNFPGFPEFVNTPVLSNNTLSITGNYTNSSGGQDIIVTKLNDIDGSHLESIVIKLAPHPLIYKLVLQLLTFSNGKYFMKGFALNNFSLSTQFNMILDTGFNLLKGRMNKTNLLLSPNFSYEINNIPQYALLGYENFTPVNKYFITFDKNDNILRSRKFTLTGNFSTLFSNTVNLDDKQNLHFLYHYPNGPFGSPLITEYARISNFAPSGTINCFGKDTSFFKPDSFNITKAPFTWDNITSNLIISSPVTFTIDTAVVSKEVVCKIVSRCDSVHINGPAAACVGVPVRYTVSKNAGCFKNLDWLIDTTVASIINLEGDSAITLNFKKTFTGYIHAALTDCVVKDSFLVTAVVPKMLPLINRKDSLLCPGKTLVLTASNGYTNYQWQGNTSGQQFTVSNTGVYTVTALDSCGIAHSDSIRVTLADTSLTIPSTQTVCLYDTAFITLPADVNNITWQPSGNSFLNNKTLLFYPQQTTLYNITAERTPNCGILKTTVVVIKTCPQTVFIPNAFTPNKNNVNDIFKPSISQPLAFYRLQIFNRYGQTIFETSNQQNGWDGTFKGSRQPMGGYIYQCSYRFAGGTQKMAKGYFILVR